MNEILVTGEKVFVVLGEYLKGVHPALLSAVVLWYIVSVCGTRSAYYLMGRSAGPGAFLPVIRYRTLGRLTGKAPELPGPFRWDISRAVRREWWIAYAVLMLAWNMTGGSEQILTQVANSACFVLAQAVRIYYYGSVATILFAAIDERPLEEKKIAGFICGIFPAVADIAFCIKAAKAKAEEAQPIE